MAANVKLLKAAEIAFDNVYHNYRYDMSDEAAIEEACKVYRDICGENPDLKDQMGFNGWFDDETFEDILNGTWQIKYEY